MRKRRGLESVRYLDACKKWSNNVEVHSKCGIWEEKKLSDAQN